MDDAICSDRPLWSARASFSAGIELTSCEVVVIGQSADWCGSLRIDHAVMSDAIDAAAVTDLRARANLTAGSALLHALLAKAEATQSGQIRGARHTMLDDSDISSTRHAGGFVGGRLAWFSRHHADLCLWRGRASGARRRRPRRHHL